MTLTESICFENVSFSCCGERKKDLVIKLFYKLHSSTTSLYLTPSLKYRIVIYYSTHVTHYYQISIHKLIAPYICSTHSPPCILHKPCSLRLSNIPTYTCVTQPLNREKGKRIRVYYRRVGHIMQVGRERARN